VIAAHLLKKMTPRRVKVGTPIFTDELYQLLKQ
jgi:hypothetical protein